MELPKNKIELLGKPYFALDFIKAFIDIIELRAPNPEKYFLQVTQKENRPNMEFGCKAGQILLDVTASAEKTMTVVYQASSVASIILTGGQNLTQLSILAPTRWACSIQPLLKTAGKN